MSFFHKRVQCPLCGAAALRSWWFQLRCSSYSCVRYDPTVEFDSAVLPQVSGRPSDFSASKSPAGTIFIRYRNFRGEMKTFEAKKDSLYIVGAHLSVEVAPKWRRIALALNSIQNRHELRV